MKRQYMACAGRVANGINMVHLSYVRAGTGTHWPGRGAWIVSCHHGRLFTRNQAITALTVIELLETGYADDDPLVVALGEELR